MRESKAEALTEVIASCHDRCVSSDIRDYMKNNLEDVLTLEARVCAAASNCRMNERGWQPLEERNRTLFEYAKPKKIFTLIYGAFNLSSLQLGLF